MPHKDEITYNIGPWVFHIANYKDWKPGYQISITDSYHFFNTDRTFKTQENAKKYILKIAKQLIRLLVKDLESKKEDK